MKRALGSVAACVLAVACILNPQPQPPGSGASTPSPPGGGVGVVIGTPADASTGSGNMAVDGGPNSDLSDAPTQGRGSSDAGPQTVDHASDGAAGPAGDAEAGPAGDASTGSEDDGDADQTAADGAIDATSETSPVVPD